MGVHVFCHLALDGECPEHCRQLKLYMILPKVNVNEEGEKYEDLGGGKHFKTCQWNASHRCACGTHFTWYLRFMNFWTAPQGLSVWLQCPVSGAHSEDELLSVAGIGDYVLHFLSLSSLGFLCLFCFRYTCLSFNYRFLLTSKKNWYCNFTLRQR